MHQQKQAMHLAPDAGQQQQQPSVLPCVKNSAVAFAAVLL
jgi:hypothetical protein